MDKGVKSQCSSASHSSCLLPHYFGLRFALRGLAGQLCYAAQMTAYFMLAGLTVATRPAVIQVNSSQAAGGHSPHTTPVLKTKMACRPSQSAERTN
jgi:hypothetical protein